MLLNAQPTHAEQRRKRKMIWEEKKRNEEGILRNENVNVFNISFRKIQTTWVAAAVKLYMFQLPTTKRRSKAKKKKRKEDKMKVKRIKFTTMCRARIMIFFRVCHVRAASLQVIEKLN